MVWAAVIPIAASIIGGMMKGSDGAGDQGFSYSPQDNLSSGSNVAPAGQTKAAPVDKPAPSSGPYDEFTKNWGSRMTDFLKADTPTEPAQNNPWNYAFGADLASLKTPNPN